MTRQLSFGGAVNEALATALELDRRVIVCGMGVGDPKNIFGTTSGLKERFGSQRVFDLPAAENALMGIAVGAALGGLRPVVTHQRLDFFLLAMDQLVNNAAKWHYTFGKPVPLVVRLIVGRGWGQGPTHSQSFQSWFAHVPGLKVLMPTLPGDAKGMLLEAIFDDDPVVWIEHRWLHTTEGAVPEGDYRVPIGKAQLLRRGDDLTIVASSLMTIEAVRAAEHLERLGCSCDVLDLRTVSPLDWGAVFESVGRTGRLIVADTGPATLSVAGEIIARVAMERFGSLKAPPRRIALPDCPVPTSPSLTAGFYPRASDIAEAAGAMLGRSFDLTALRAAENAIPHDVPGAWFKGPF